MNRRLVPSVLLSLSLFAPLSAGAAAVTASLTYPAGTVLPAGAVVEAEVHDEFASDIPNVVAHSESPAKGPTQTITLNVDAAKIQGHHPYTFVVSVKSGGKYILYAPQKYGVLTKGNPSQVSVALTTVPMQPETRPYGPALEETYWKLLSVGSVAATASKKEPFFRLNAFNMTLAGTGGCNNFTGGYAADAQTVTFSNVAATKMVCPAGTNQDEALLAALQGARQWKVTGDRLNLMDGKGAVVATFQAVAPQPLHPIEQNPIPKEPGSDSKTPPEQGGVLH
jgi:putative lipoprotein